MLSMGTRRFIHRIENIPTRLMQFERIHTKCLGHTNHRIQESEAFPTPNCALALIAGCIGGMAMARDYIPLA